MTAEERLKAVFKRNSLGEEIKADGDIVKLTVSGGAKTHNKAIKIAEKAGFSCRCIETIQDGWDFFTLCYFLEFTALVKFTRKQGINAAIST